MKNKPYPTSGKSHNVWDEEWECDLHRPQDHLIAILVVAFDFAICAVVFMLIFLALWKLKVDVMFAIPIWLVVMCFLVGWYYYSH